MTIQANQGPGVSIFGATSAGGGGSTSPGGSSGQVQYNNGGSFGGMAGTSWDDTNRALTLTGATVTTSQPVLNLSQTWNDGAVPFTGMVFNAAGSSGTNSAAGSLLLDLQVGGASKFSVNKSGYGLFPNGAYGSPSIAISTTGKGFYYNTSQGALYTFDGGDRFYVKGANAGVCSGGAITWSSSDASAIEVYLTRGASSSASTPQLQLGAADVASGAVPQTLQVQSNTGASTTGPNFTIKGSAGTTAGGSIIFQTAATTSFAAIMTLTANNNVTLGTNTSLNVPIINNSSYTIITGQGLYLRNNSIEFAMGASDDVKLFRDGQPNTLALKNAGNPQIFRVYSTTASSGSYGIISAGVQPDGTTVAADTLYIGSAGSGAAMTKLALVTNGTTRADYNISSANTWTLSGGLVVNGPSSTVGTNSNFKIGGDAWVGGSRGAATSYLGSWAYGILGFPPTDGVITLYNTANNDFNRLQFGGTTSSFPALKRISSGNCLQVIAADNTASAGFIVGNQALATTATDGFLYVPTCAGLPTGTPTTQTGTAPIVVDTTNNKLYFYSGGQWRDAGP
jgi:hypothetical protein